MAHDKKPFWEKQIEDLFKELSSNYNGLTSKQSAHALKRYGTNSLRTIKQQSAFNAFLGRFKNPLVLLLLISAILIAFIGESKSALLIIIITLSSTLIDFVQERKASRSAELLKRMVKIKSLVFRDCEKRQIGVDKLAPGDIIELSAGNLVPADGYLLAANDFFVDQSSLTGESFPVEKRRENNLVHTSNPAHASHIVLSGTSVISGWARILICQTGSQTVLGLLAKTLNSENGTNSFLISMQEFGLFLMRLTFLLVMIVLIINLYQQRPWIDTVLFSIALGVGMTPEFLPMIISVSLAHSGNRLTKQNIITKRLSSIYALGRMDVLCTDKTGTLTEAHLKLDSATDFNGVKDEQTFLYAYLNSYFESGFKSPIDAAILEHDMVDMNGWLKIDEIPFDSAHKRISVLLSNGRKKILTIKGPLEDILKNCRYVIDKTTDELIEIDKNIKETILARFILLSEQGIRVLGVSFKHAEESKANVSVDDEKELIFAGLLSFFDQPRADAGNAINKLSHDGIQVKIITGDNEHVTKCLCKKLNIPIQGLLLGDEIQKLTDTQLHISVEEKNIFCRVTPDQKGRIIRLLKANGHTVGFLGDGVNDVYALRSADVAISVENAVDIAKETANFILTKRSLNVLHQGVLEGRRTFSNILKYIMMGTSSNLGNMISMVGASLFLPFLPMLPVQILLNNLLYDLSEIAIPFDHVDAQPLRMPAQWSIDFIKKFMTIFGPLSSFFDFCAFYIFLTFLKANEPLFQTGWFLGSLAMQILIIFVIRTRKSALRSRPHPYLIISSLGALTLGVILIWSPLASLFKFQALPTPFLATLCVLTLFYLCLAEIIKKRFYKKMKLYTHEYSNRRLTQ